MVISFPALQHLTDFLVGGGEAGLSVTGTGTGGQVFVAQRDDFKATNSSCDPLGVGIDSTDCYAWSPSSQAGEILLLSFYLLFF